MKRRPTRPVSARRPPFFVEIAGGKRTHDAAVIDADETLGRPKALTSAHTYEG